ncbi:MAG TPA: CAP domain-containing protein [Acidimicrobiales bacterium]|nr:CAP domain-containing protein [Acidimicrobiales bacterium]
MSWGRRPQPVRRLVLLVLGPCLLSLAALGCAPAPTPAPPSAGPAAEVVTLTNARRAAAGCGPVTAQAQLTLAAQLHADDMARYDYFSHTGRDGSAPWDRARAQGYTGRMMGENIARGYETPQAVVTGWIDSPGHRANIENCGYRHIGVGYDATTKTWVQLFGG